ncbi:MAG: putative pyrroline-5-carboxylate reductase [Chloroflexi bacterium]|nr:putative pyrroline-5-carboxylate reductase [Chloroflexota bacterium]
MEAMRPDSPQRIAIIGVGRLGSVLGCALQRAGYPVVAYWNRTDESQSRARAVLGGFRPTRSLDETAAEGDIVILTVPDDAIPSVDASIGWRIGQIAVHCSGAVPAAALVNASSRGGRAAGFHPLQTFADLDTGLRNLPGSTVGIEADDDTWPVLSRMADALETTPLRLHAEDRAIYHLGSVIVSNFTIGLMTLASELWAGIGLDRDQASRALAPLLAGTVRNVEALGAWHALTGPVVRGDVGTVIRHRAALAGQPAALEIYDAVSRQLVRVAIDQGKITPSQAAALLETLANVVTVVNVVT